MAHNPHRRDWGKLGLFAKDVSCFHFCLHSSFDLIWIAMLLAISKLGDPVVWVSIILVPADVSCHCFSLPMGLIQGISPFALRCQAAAHWQCKYGRQALKHSFLSWCWCLTWHQLPVMPSGLQLPLCVTSCSWSCFLLMFASVALELYGWICTPEAKGCPANLNLPSSRRLIQNCYIFCSMYEWQFEYVWLALHIPAQHMLQPWLWLYIFILPYTVNAGWFKMLLMCYWMLFQKANHNGYSTLLLSCIADYYHMFCTIFCFIRYSHRWVMSSNTIYLQRYHYNALRHIAQKADIGVVAQPLEACKGIFMVFLTSVTHFFPQREENSSYHSCKSAPIIIHLNICLVTAYFRNFRGC